MYGWDDGRHWIDFHALPVCRDDVITITEDRYMVRSDFTNHGGADEGVGESGYVAKSIRKAFAKNYPYFSAPNRYAADHLQNILEGTQKSDI